VLVGGRCLVAGVSAYTCAGTRKKGHALVGASIWPLCKLVTHREEQIPRQHVPSTCSHAISFCAVMGVTMVGKQPSGSRARDAIVTWVLVGWVKG